MIVTDCALEYGPGAGEVGRCYLLLSRWIELA